MAQQYFDNTIVIEPSAGNGSFSKQIPNCVSYDIKPESEDIIEKNFYNLVLDENTTLIGNPPFGSRSKEAISFFNHGASFNIKTIAFILPITFKKWSVQKQLHPNYSLVNEKLLPANSFLSNNKDFSVRCVFQVWQRNDIAKLNLRLKKQPPIKHEDFEIWQYNATKSAEKYFNYDWDFAVYRQGYKDYSHRFFPNDRDNMDRRIQYMFFKAKNNDILKKLIELDFKELSEWNLSTPGFGKADLVMYYNYNQINGKYN